MINKTNMHKYYVTKVDRRGAMNNIFKMLETCHGALPYAAVIAAADPGDKIRQPKLTYALSVTLPERGCDVAIVGECSTRDGDGMGWDAGTKSDMDIY